MIKIKTIEPREDNTTQPWNIAMNHEIWRYIFDAIEDTVFLQDAQFRVLLANRAYLFGRPVPIEQFEALLKQR